MTFEEKRTAAAASHNDNQSVGESTCARSSRQEPTFSDFDEEDYEEPERDTDHATAYEDDNLGEEYVFVRPSDEECDEVEITPAHDLAGYAAGILDSHPFLTDDPGLEAAQMEDDDEEEGYDDTQAARRRRWPLGLITVAIVALLLLAAGGYGVVQERFAMQEEIRELTAKLANAVYPEEMVRILYEKRELELAKDEYTRVNEALTVENRRLEDMVAGLESQLEAQKLSPSPGHVELAQAKAGTRPEAPEAAKPASAKPPKAKSATAEPPATGPGPVTPSQVTATTADGNWFVNFGSYSRSAAAQAWAHRIKPAAGRVVVIGADRDGVRFYRVRVVELSDRSAAEMVSRELEAQYGLPKLWVGRE